MSDTQQLDTVQTELLSDSGEEIEREADTNEECPVFRLQVSPNRLEATLSVVNASEINEVSYEQVMQYLTECGITYGIYEESIHRFCDSKKYNNHFLCAKGVPSVDGQDGVLEIQIDTEKDMRPKEREDGTVDFHDLEIIENVHQGDVLCRLIPPTEGKCGVDVYNQPISFRRGRKPSLPTGNNTVISEDGLSLLSRVDGCVEYKNQQINVDEVFIVRGDVNNVTGNIDSVSSISIQGDVLEGFCVKSQKDITIRGMVEGALIEAKGNITISNGMNGMGHGIIKAGGKVTARYFENGTIISEGDVFAENFVNCRVETKGSIALKGRKASIIGGSYQAGKSITAKNVGNASQTKTVVSISSTRLDEIYSSNEGYDSIEILQNKLAEFQKGLEILEQQMQAVSDSIQNDRGKMSDKKRVWLKAASTKKTQITSAIQTIQKSIQLEEDGNMQLSDFKINVSGIAHPGVKIEIGPYSLQLLQENSCVKFYGTMNKIELSPLMQAEIEVH